MLLHSSEFMQAHAGTSSSGSSTQEESLQQHQQIAVLNKRIATLDRENQHLQAEVSRLAAFTTALQASSAGAQNAPAAPTKPHAPAETSAEAEQQKQQGAESGSSGSRAGLALLKPGPHRLAGTLKSVGSVGMPETPTDAASTGGGGGRLGGRRGRGAAAGRGFSSDGGGSVAGSSTLAGAHDPAGQAGREDMQASQSQAAAAASAAGGVTYATQHWEETKQLQGKVDALRWEHTAGLVPRAAAAVTHLDVNRLCCWLCRCQQPYGLNLSAAWCLCCVPAQLPVLCSNETLTRPAHPQEEARQEE